MDIIFHIWKVELPEFKPRILYFMFDLQFKLNFNYLFYYSKREADTDPDQEKKSLSDLRLTGSWLAKLLFTSEWKEPESVSQMEKNISNEEKKCVSLRKS